MRKIILCAVAAALTCGGVALANSNGTAGHGHHGQVRVITLFSSTVQFKQLDLGDSGFSFSLA